MSSSSSSSHFFQLPLELRRHILLFMASPLRCHTCHSRWEGQEEGWRILTPRYLFCSQACYLGIP